MDLTNPTKTVTCWVELYTSKLLSWAIYKVSDKALAEDLVQDTFLAAVQSFQKFKSNSEPQTWLFAILNHKIIDHYRKQIRTNDDHLNDSDAAFFDESGHWREDSKPQLWQAESPHLLDDIAFNKVLNECIKRLPVAWMAAMKLKYHEEKEGKIICQELGITQSNFWQMLHRAKLQLRACIETHWFKK